MGSECLFCGTGGASILSKEDVVPVWLLKYLELPPDDQLFQGVAESATGELIRRRIHSSFTFFEGRVCKTACNNGWMSRLESGTKPILIPLMENKRPVADLSPTEKAIVGK